MCHITKGIELSKSRKYQDTWRKGNLQVHENIRSGHYQTRGDERKILKRSISGEGENFSKPSSIARILSKG